MAYANLPVTDKPNVGWRRLFTDASILRSLSDCLTPAGEAAPSTGILMKSIARLDHAIIIAGACGEGRLELIHHLIRCVQAYLPSTSIPLGTSALIAGHDTQQIPNSLQDIPCLDTPPSFSAFISLYSQGPFILRGFACDWPALQNHPWNSPKYLQSVAGPGRIVPVEVGRDYREADWSQTLMKWDDFLSNVFAYQSGETVLYLAQHNLFAQFPALQDDIIIPDYVYASLPPPKDYPHYRPPGNDEQLVLNVWLGPRGTISPAHTDPFFNFYVQVVGEKTVWLAPPHATPYMYSYPSTDVDPSPHAHNPASNKASPSMSNTSQVDVFAPPSEHGDFPLFQRHVPSLAMSATLQPGDMLFFPPGWWHAMRSESTSFSVSMWF
ncbi:Clavaminate synthase-like protein [Panus rudis PR-1116 ss-1]|nr:Clavaminate synthase-like protein [Panus rudis PR-1116 ss-1]